MHNVWSYRLCTLYSVHTTQTGSGHAVETDVCRTDWGTGLGEIVISNILLTVSIATGRLSSAHTRGLFGLCEKLFVKIAILSGRLSLIEAWSLRFEASGAIWAWWFLHYRTDLSVRDWSLRIRYTCGTLQCSQNRARAMGHLKYMIILLDPKNAKIGFHSRLRKIKFQLTFLIRVSRTLSQNGICV